MKIIALLFISILFNIQAYGSQELLSLLNRIEHNEKLMKKSMGITAKQDFEEVLEKLNTLSDSNLDEFNIDFKNKLIQRVRDNIEKESQTLSSCKFLATKYENQISSWVDNNPKNREDSLARWQKLRIVKLDIQKHSSCNDLKKLWSLIDQIKFEKFI